MLVLAWYTLASVVAFTLYARDKRAARRGTRRVPERRLHLAEALGGWPGALLARPLLRHKTRKRGFLLVSWVIIAAHAGVWGAWAVWG